MTVVETSWISGSGSLASAHRAFCGSFLRHGYNVLHPSIWCANANQSTSRLNWVSFAILATPIRSQLSALIFVKSLHMKDVKGTNGPATESESHPKKVRKGKGDQAGEADGYELETLLSDEDDSGGADDSQSSSVNNAGNGDDSKSSEGAQGPINLLGVDVQRFSDFYGYSVDLLRSLIKVTLAIIFLVSLIGWWRQALPLSFPPLNEFLTSKQYARWAFGAVPVPTINKNRVKVLYKLPTCGHDGSGREDPRCHRSIAGYPSNQILCHRRSVATIDPSRARARTTCTMASHIMGHIPNILLDLNANPAGSGCFERLRLA